MTEIKPLREPDILQYLPGWLQKYGELEEITDSENPEFRFDYQVLARMLTNAFIGTADHQGLERLAELFGVGDILESGWSDEDIRIYLRSVYNDFPAYTLEALQDKINSICNDSRYHDVDNGVNISWTWPHGYELEISTRVNSPARIRAVNQVVHDWVPANIKVDLKNELGAENELHNGAAIASVNSEYYTGFIGNFIAAYDNGKFYPAFEASNGGPYEMPQPGSVPRAWERNDGPGVIPTRDEA